MTLLSLGFVRPKTLSRQRDRQKDRQTDGMDTMLVETCMWIDGLTGRWMDGWMFGWVLGIRYVGGWSGELCWSVGGWIMDGWMDG